ncbi:MAG TPA: hypothetical protein DCX27_21950 [Balneola sp.]|nr:hypothetical protein [Balneola sp.]
MNKADITGKTISSFTLYKFVQDLTRPFTTFPAYHMGLIDRDGYFTVPVDEIPSSISTFDLFIIYIKRLFDQIPNPATSSKLKSATSALTLFREELDEYDLDSNYIITGILNALVEEGMIEEDVAGVMGNSVGSGNFAGMGYVEHGDGFDDLAINITKVRKNRKRKRKNPLASLTPYRRR